MKSAFTIFTACIFVCNSQAQSPVFYAESAIKSKRESSIFSNDAKDIYRLDVRAFTSYLSHAGKQAEFSLSFGEQQNWKFNLETVEFRKSDYVLYVGADNGIVSYPGTDDGFRTFRGTVNGDPESRVRLCVFEDRIMGLVYQGSESFYFSQAAPHTESVSSDNIVLKNMKDINVLESICGTDDVPMPSVKMMNSVASASAGCKQIDMVLGCESKVYTKYGSVGTTQAYLFFLFNYMAEQTYAPFFPDIVLNVVATFIPTSASADPVTTTTDGQTLLNQLEAWGPSFFKTNYDIGLFWFLRNLYNGSTNIGGKASGIGATCSGKNWAIVEISPPEWVNDPVYAIERSVMTLATHEIGHNLNCVHITGQFIMNAATTGGNTTWGSSQTTLANYVASASCFAACTPLASFAVSNPSCNTSVNFTNTSASSTSWSWNFGDGATSTDINPVHTYANTGTYTVSLTAKGTAGETTVSQVITVMSGTPGASQFVGPADNTIGTGLYSASNQKWYNDLRHVYFDVDKQLLIKSVEVYSDMAGNRTIHILNNKFEIVFSKTVNIGTGKQKIALDAELPPGKKYSMKLSGTSNVYLNTAGAKYPYTINGLISITDNDLYTTPDVKAAHFLYFYNWEVQAITCSSSPTGIIENNTEAFSIYPNPASASVKIEGVYDQVDIINVIGENVYSYFGQGGHTVRNIESGHFQAGVYFVRVKSGNAIYTKKLIKE